MNLTFKDAIDDLVARHQVSRLAPREAAILQFANSMPEGAGDLPKAKDYDEISARLAALLGSGQRLTSGQLRDGAWCLWKTSSPISERSDLLAAFLGQLRELKHKGASRALAVSYLISFHSDRPGLSAVAAALRDLASVMGKPFDELRRKLRIFDEVEGPKLIGDVAFSERKSPSAVLEESGMRMQQVLAGDYVEPCARRVLQRAAEDQRLPALERLEFIKLVAVKPGTQTLQFTSHKNLVANALLRPHIGRSVDKAIKDSTLDFLISLDELGDPRTKSGNWVNIPEARDLAFGWLTEQALRQFLDVVETVNPNQNWRFRRRFWESMYKREVISGAWVVLDSNGAAEAHRRFGRNAQFGRFSGGGVQTGHAVLLLRIGAGVCAEWSFNGKCRFWTDAQRTGAPELYKTGYDANDLKNGIRYSPVEEITHSSHEGQNAWQHKAARRISSMTGERFNSRDYM